MKKKKTTDRVIFTKEMKKTHTILFPDMLPIHFEIIRHVFDQYGYRTEVLHNDGREVIYTGLKYVHNDTCYPALLVIGQFINALQSGKYDLDHTALMITQTGGGCRASNYIFLLRKALKKAGFEQIPVISLNTSGLESNPGFQLTIPMLVKMMVALVYGDELMLLSNQVRPYEKHQGDADALVGVWVKRIGTMLSSRRGLTLPEMRRLFDEIAQAFAAVPQKRCSKIRVGVVGEIYVKFSPLGNNGLEKFLLEQGCEVMVPGVMGFIMYTLSNQEVDHRLYGGNVVKSSLSKVALHYLEAVEGAMLDAIRRTGCFTAPSPFPRLEELGDRVINRGSKMGEGWLLTAETLELIENGYPNVICTQPFGCLPNHINGRGMMNRIKELAPQANIVAIDYDSGAASVNQENRIKLMLSSAKRSGDPDSAPMEEKRSHSNKEEYAMT